MREGDYKMDLNYFVDTLFDLINESDALEADLLDVRADENVLTVSMKDGTRYELLARKIED